MRDQLKSKKYWSEFLPDHEAFIDEIAEDLLVPDPAYAQRIGDLFDLQRHIYQHASAHYASGSEIEKIREVVIPAVTHAYPQFVAVCREQPAQAKREYGGGWDFRYKYLALAILFGLSTEESQPLVDALHSWAEPDAGMDRMIAHLGHDVPDRKPAAGLLWPEAYAPLLEAMEPEASEIGRTASLRNFQQNWLKQMRTSTNLAYSNHDNRHNTYVGYWCWEAAAVSVMMGIVDSTFRDHAHYPKDLADWARDRRISWQTPQVRCRPEQTVEGPLVKATRSVPGGSPLRDLFFSVQCCST